MPQWPDQPRLLPPSKEMAHRVFVEDRSKIWCARTDSRFGSRMVACKHNIERVHRLAQEHGRSVEGGVEKDSHRHRATVSVNKLPTSTRKMRRMRANGRDRLIIYE